MATIKCPKCGEAITIDENDYAKIANQVKDELFQKELESQTKVLESKHISDIKLAVNEAISLKDKEIAGLKEQIATLSGDLQLKDKEKALEIQNVEKKYQQEIKNFSEEKANIQNNLEEAYDNLKSKKKTSNIAKYQQLHNPRFIL